MRQRTLQKKIFFYSVGYSFTNLFIVLTRIECLLQLMASTIHPPSFAAYVSETHLIFPRASIKAALLEN